MLQSMASRLCLDLDRARARDDRLYERDKIKVKKSKMYCPCTACTGKLTLLNFRTIIIHLLANGRNHARRLWRDQWNRDESDDEWEEYYWSNNLQGDHVVVDEALD